MFKVIFSFVIVLLVGCSAGPDIIHPIAKDSAQYPANPAILNMPLTMMVISVDGKKQSTALLNTDPYQIHLAEGPHRIDFHYYYDWGVGDNAELITSDVMSLLVKAKAGQSYSLDYDKPSSMKEALALTKGFDAWYIDPLSHDKVSATHKGHYKSAPTQALGSLFNGGVGADSEPDSEELSELQSVWMRSSDDERQAFMKWVFSQSK